MVPTHCQDHVRVMGQSTCRVPVLACPQGGHGCYSSGPRSGVYANNMTRGGAGCQEKPPREARALSGWDLARGEEGAAEGLAPACGTEPRKHPGHGRWAEVPNGERVCVRWRVTHPAAPGRGRGSWAVRTIPGLAPRVASCSGTCGTRTPYDQTVVTRVALNLSSVSCRELANLGGW